MDRSLPARTAERRGGGGSVTERNPGEEAKTTAGIQAGETLQHSLNGNASIKRYTTAVWNTNDLQQPDYDIDWAGDAYIDTFSAVDRSH